MKHDDHGKLGTCIGEPFESDLRIAEALLSRRAMHVWYCDSWQQENCHITLWVRHGWAFVITLCVFHVMGRRLAL